MSTRAALARPRGATAGVGARGAVGCGLVRGRSGTVAGVRRQTVAGRGAVVGQCEECLDVGLDRLGSGLHRGQNRLLGGPEVLHDGRNLLRCARPQVGVDQDARCGRVGVDPRRTYGLGTARSCGRSCDRRGRGRRGGRGGGTGGPPQPAMEASADRSVPRGRQVRSRWRLKASDSPSLSSAARRERAYCGPITGQRVSACRSCNEFSRRQTRPARRPRLGCASA
jgi:hypothetical protein